MLDMGAQASDLFFDVAALGKHGGFLQHAVAVDDPIAVQQAPRGAG